MKPEIQDENSEEKMVENLNSSSIKDSIIKAVTELTVGEILRRARLEQKINFEKIYRDLRLKKEIIEALENDDYAALPSQAYTIGYIKTYAEYLGLDSKKCIQLLKEYKPKAQERPVYNFPQLVSDKLSPPLWLVWGSLIFITLFLGLWSFKNFSKQDISIPEVPQSLKNQLTPPPKPKIIPKITTNISQPQNQNLPTQQETQSFIIKAIQDSWIDVRDSQGQTIFSRILKTDEEFYVPLEQGAHTLTTGNAGGIILIKNGTASEPLGNAGQVLRNIELRP